MIEYEKGLFQKKDGTLAMVTCPKCGFENYASAVLIGICTWCGYDCNSEENKDD